MFPSKTMCNITVTCKLKANTLSESRLKNSDLSGVNLESFMEREQGLVKGESSGENCDQNTTQFFPGLDIPECKIHKFVGAIGQVCLG